MTRRGRILFVGNYLDSHVGTRAISEELALQLGQRGWSTILTSRKTNRVLRIADMLRTIVARRGEIDAAVVDLYSGPAFVWAEAACELLLRLGKPFVLTLHGGNLPAFAQHSPTRVCRLMSKACAITAPSGYLAHQMRIYRPDLEVIPNPLDVGQYPYSRRSKIQPRLVWLRAFHKIYNAPMAVSVAALLMGEFPETSLTMVGPDKDGSLAQAENCARQLGVISRIRFSGPVPKTEVPATLAQGDVFLNTTNVDNTPVSVLEAMACGLCVVSTNVGGIPYLLRNQWDALLTPAGDARAMAAAVRQLLTDSSLAERVSETARRKAADLDWSLVLPTWERLLGEVISPSKCPQKRQPVLSETK